MNWGELTRQGSESPASGQERLEHQGLMMLAAWFLSPFRPPCYDYPSFGSWSKPAKHRSLYTSSRLEILI